MGGEEVGFVAQARVGAGFDHHGEEGGGEVGVGGGEGLREGVDEADCGVQGGVAFAEGEGVAFEAFLVEEHVYNIVYGLGEDD